LHKPREGGGLVGVLLGGVPEFLGVDGQARGGGLNEGQVARPGRLVADDLYHGQADGRGRVNVTIICTSRASLCGRMRVAGLGVVVIFFLQLGPGELVSPPAILSLTVGPIDGPPLD